MGVYHSLAKIRLSDHEVVGRAGTCGVLVAEAHREPGARRVAREVPGAKRGEVPLHLHPGHGAARPRVGEDAREGDREVAASAPDVEDLDRVAALEELGEGVQEEEVHDRLAHRHAAEAVAPDLRAGVRVPPPQVAPPRDALRKITALKPFAL